MRSAKQIHRSLKSIIFAQIFTMGCVYPVVSYYMQSVLHFDAMAASVVLAGSTIAAITTPLAAAFVADRLVSSRALLVACNLLGGAANLFLVFSHDFAGFFAGWLLMSIAQGPAGGLINTLAFRHLEDGVRQYGPIRLWGTVGWIAAGWLLSLAWMVLPLLFPAADPAGFKPLIFALALAGSLAGALLALTLPPDGVRAPAARGLRALVPVEALAAVKTRLFVVLIALYAGNSIMDRFFFFGAAPYLPVAGFPPDSVLAVMTVGQLVEIPVLAVLGRYLTRMGFRNGLLVGLLLQVLRPLLLALPGPASALAGLCLHGVLVGFVQLSLVMQANHHCDAASRSGVNQIFAFFYGGVANLAGSIGAGAVLGAVDRHPHAGAPTDQASWSLYWLCAAGVGLVLVAAFLLWYPRRADGGRPAADPA